jgi:hypothetical protein
MSVRHPYYLRVPKLLYNHEHRHTGIGLMTPAAVHHGQSQAVSQVRKEVLAAAFKAHPERFVRGMPNPPAVPKAAWINKPKIECTDGAPAKTALIPGMVGYEPVRDRRSWAILEADFLDPVTEATGSNTKFESEVSQSH